MDNDDVLRITDLTRRFGKIVANNEVSLRVRPGEIVGLLGHNGAGKTTLVSQITGLLKPDSGDIRVGEIDAVRDPRAARRHVAVQPQEQAPIDGLTPRTAMEVAGRIRGLSVARARATAIELAEELDIGPWLDQRALPEGGGLSGGIRRLTGFAMAIAAPTPLLILDEPTNDIDASRRRLLWQALRRRGDQGIGVLLVTHNVAEAERVVDELVILDHGQVVATGSPAQLTGAQHTEMRLELQLPSLGGERFLKDMSFPTMRHVHSGRRRLITIAEDSAPEAIRWATAQRTTGNIEGFSLAPVTLEDSYLSLVSPTEAQNSTHNEKSRNLQEFADV